MIRILLVLVVLATMASQAAALQTLIPAPYPNSTPGATPLDPETPEPGDPQTLLRDPYPQILGDQAQGNPPIARRHKLQRLVPSIYQRRYRVDRYRPRLKLDQ